MKNFTYKIEFAPSEEWAIISNTYETNYYENLETVVRLFDYIIEKGTKYARIIRNDGAIYLEYEF